MTIKQATTILKSHNRWRRGETKTNKYAPYEIGNAIDAIINYIELRPTGLKDKKGIELKLGDKFKYTKAGHKSLNVFTAKVLWIKETACFGFVRDDNPKWLCPFAEYHELKEDFLNYIEKI